MIDCQSKPVGTMNADNLYPLARGKSFAKIIVPEVEPVPFGILTLTFPNQVFELDLTSTITSLASLAAKPKSKVI